MKTKITFIALAIFAMVSINATTPTTWSIVATGNSTEKGEVAWGDFNNDGYLDLFQVSNNAFSLYKNNGNETFTNVASTKFPLPLPGGVQQAMVIFMDYNNDGNLDLVVSGSNGTTSQTTLYKNSGAPDYTFTIDINNSLLGLRTGDDGDSHKFLSAVDYNNDGWVDLFMEGWSDALNARVVTLYKNVGGTFVRQTTPVGGTADFEGINGGSLHTGDVNNDGFVDMICSGYSSVSGYDVTNLYLNQGDGTFVKSSASFAGIEQGGAVLFDSNNDGWLDVFIAGVSWTGNWAWPGTLYLNNQDGTFTTVAATSTNLPSGTQGYTSFSSGDVNNDGKTDLMVMLPGGENTAMYYNNGDNTFLKDVLPVAVRARAGSMDLADFNNDNKLDYFLFGYNDNLAWLGVFAKNTTTVANLAPSVPTNIVATKANGKYTITWDKSTDDITTQEAIRYNVFVKNQYGKIYTFSPADITTGRLKTGSQTLLNKNQLVLELPDGQYTIGVQSVDQANVASAFGTIQSTTLASWLDVASGSGYDKGEVAWGDFNNDGYLDLFQISHDAFALYMNNGNETFTNVAATAFPATVGLDQSMVLFMDYNNDGNLDLVVSGNNGTTSVTTLYKNSGAPNYTFTVDTNNSLLGMKTGGNDDSHKFLSAVDFNNDGWVDLFMEGWCDALNTRVVTLYKNVAGTFVRQTTPVEGTADFEGMNGGALHTGDVNHDGYVDLLCSGYTVGDKFRTYLYLNQGNGTFIKSPASFPGVEQGEALLFDSNNDGWLDVVVVGVGHDGTNWIYPGNLYLNNQDGTFTESLNTNLPNGAQGYSAFASGDLNNDGKSDLMIMFPWTIAGNTGIFYNNGDNTFTKTIPECQGRARGGSLDFADFNNDNNLDYFAFGYRDGYTFPDNTTIAGGWASSFVKNTITIVNAAPSVPTNLTVTNVNGKYVITWDKSTDDITVQNAIRYNVYVQNQSGTVYAFSPADLATGRLKTGSQTLLYKNEFVLDLPAGTYTAGVQSVDQANVASAFNTAVFTVVVTKIENTLTSKVAVKSINKKIEIQNDGIQNVNVALISLNGQSLFKGTCNAGSKMVIPMSLNQGVYLVKLSKDNTTQTVKVSVL